jgi:alpha-1,2-mannosyltransferase
MSPTTGAVSGSERLALLTRPMDSVASVDKMDVAVSRSTPRIGRATTVGIVLVAIALRLGPTLAHGTLRGTLEYDDGVHLGAAIHLLAGLMPYRSFTFVQPPGIVVLLTPFAALARLIGEPDSMAAIRICMALLGAGNALLCARCAAPWGRRAAVAAGVFYAAWPVVVVPERTVLLEPILTAGVLGALLVLRRRSRWSTPLAGLILGLAITVKLVVLPLVLVIAVFVLARRGWRVAATLGSYIGGAVVVLAAPFVAQSPGNAWRMVVADQIGRPGTADPLLVRLGTLDGNVFSLSTHHGAAPLVGGLLMLAIYAAAIKAPKGLEGAGLWILLLSAALAEVLFAPNFYYHYGALLGGPAAVLAGLGCARVSHLRWKGLATITLAAGVFVVCGFACVSLTVSRGAVVNTNALEEFFAHHPCSVATSSLLIAGNDDLRSTQMGCHIPVDAFGTQLDLGRALGAESPAGEVGVQVIVPGGVTKSSGVVLEGPLKIQGWSEGTIRAFEHRFELSERFGTITTWVPRAS